MVLQQWQTIALTKESNACQCHFAKYILWNWRQREDFGASELKNGPIKNQQICLNQVKIFVFKNLFWDLTNGKSTHSL